jgi:tRNA(Arg) A34 adenosine deaminase TadA
MYGWNDESLNLRVTLNDCVICASAAILCGSLYTVKWDSCDFVNMAWLNDMHVQFAIYIYMF